MRSKNRRYGARPQPLIGAFNRRLVLTEAALVINMSGDSPVAQLVEQVTVNHLVGSSSLSRGAIFLGFIVLNLQFDWRFFEVIG